MNVRRTAVACGSSRRRGAVMVEFALIIPVIMTLLFGLIEFGFAFRDGLTVASAARAGARVGANLGDIPETDYNIVISIQAALAELPSGTRLIKVVVYKPTDGAGGIDPSCMTGAAMTAGGVNNLCNVYDPLDISGATPGWFGCVGADRDKKWCPTTRGSRLSHRGLDRRVCRDRARPDHRRVPEPADDRHPARCDAPRAGSEHMNLVREATTPSAPHERERAYVLIMLTMLLVPMFAVAGFATDVGSWYVQASRVQHAADAGALAGVVWMPDIGAATLHATEAMRQNGFDPSDPRFEITVTPVGDQRLNVEITDHNVDLFFSKIVLDHMEITRSATAEYLKPLPLGSPLNNFGNDPTCALASCLPNWWAAIQGPFTKKKHGDPYATSCDTVPAVSPGTTCATANTEYRPSGYWYIVEVPQSLMDLFGGSVPINIEVYDAGFYERGTPFSETGDYKTDFSTNAPSFQIEAFRNDNTPLDHTDNPSWPGGACRRTIVAEASSATYQNRWHVVCRIVVSAAGTFPVNVRTSDLAGGAPVVGSATSNYSLRVRAECGASFCPPNMQPRFYGVRDYSIFLNPGAGSTAEFFTAEVNETAIGKEFTVELFDPGDGVSGDYFMSLIDPRTNSPVTSCNWLASDGRSGTLSPCRIQTSNAGVSQFDGQWLFLTYEIPVGYVCTPPAGTGCWWKMRYEFPGASSPSDRITVRVSVKGDPVKLVS